MRAARTPPRRLVPPNRGGLDHSTAAGLALVVLICMSLAAWLPRGGGHDAD
jgi:hypothetical protein